MRRLRIGSIISLPMGLLLLVFFFLPWVRLSCGTEQVDITLGTASGWQLSNGTYSEFEPGEEGGAALSEEVHIPKGTEIDARPKFYLALAASLGIAAVAGLGLWGKLSAEAAGHLLALLGALGIVMMVMVVFVDFHDETKTALNVRNLAELSRGGGADASERLSEAKQEEMGRISGKIQAALEDKALLDMIETKCTNYVWFSMQLYVLVAITGVLMVLLGRVAPKSARAGAMPPAEPERKKLPKEKKKPGEKGEHELARRVPVDVFAREEEEADEAEEDQTEDEQTESEPDEEEDEEQDQEEGDEGRGREGRWPSS